MRHVRFVSHSRAGLECRQQLPQQDAQQALGRRKLGEDSGEERSVCTDATLSDAEGALLIVPQESLFSITVQYMYIHCICICNIMYSLYMYMCSLVVSASGIHVHV